MCGKKFENEKIRYSQISTDVNATDKTVFNNSRTMYRLNLRYAIIRKYVIET